VILLSEAAGAAPEASALCLAGDDDVTSRALLETAERLGEAAGDPELLMIGVAETGRAAADAVVARIRAAGCPVLAWVGGTPVAASVLPSIPDPPPVVGTSRMKTDDGLDLASSGGPVFTVCGCADVSLSTDPRWQRFVHDLQAESGAPPGPFAVEAYDAGRLLIALLERTDGTRPGVASALDDLSRFGGLAGGYTFEPDGSRGPEPLHVGIWRAAGSRWLPRAARTAASASPV
jgi:hypothetical protein